MKSYKQLTEEIFLEGDDRYPGDDMTMKELKIAVNAAKNILDMLKDGAMIQRWQISAIVVASDELAAVCTSLRADDEDDWEDDEDEDEMEYDEYDYPSMYGEAVEKQSYHYYVTHNKGDKNSDWKVTHSKKKPFTTAKDAADHIMKSGGRQGGTIHTVNSKTGNIVQARSYDSGQAGYARDPGIGDPRNIRDLKEEVELDEEATKIDIPKSRYLTIAKMHNASGPTSGKVTKSPKNTMQYKGARHLKFDKQNDTHIEQTYSHGDHGLPTIEKHTHKPTGEVKYFMYKKPVKESVELDEVTMSNAEKAFDLKKRAEAHKKAMLKHEKTPGDGHEKFLKARTSFINAHKKLKELDLPKQELDDLRKGTNISEEVELDEVAKKTLASYITKASHEVLDRGFESGFKSGRGKSDKAVEKPYKKGEKRLSGIARAAAKLAKEEVELDEKLKASDDMGTWVKDFKDSDAPQFKGRSMKKRQQMAVAAKLSANEEADYRVSVDGLPDMYVNGSSPDQVKANLRKIVKNPKSIQSVDRITQSMLKKIFRDKAAGKEDTENS